MRPSAAALLAVWVALPALPARAGPDGRDKRLLEAMELYDWGKFVPARDILAPLVDAPGLSDADRIQARIFLGATYFLLKDKASARAQFMALHRQFPGVKLDDGYFMPEIVELSERAYAEVRRERPPSPQPPPARSPLAPPAPAPRPPAGPGLLALVPFGVGQFARGEDAKGYAFLWSELATLGMGLSGFAYFQSLKRPPSQPWVLGTAYVEDVPHARGVQVFYVSSGVLAAAIALYGILDAAFSSPPVPVSAVAGAGEAGLVVRF